MRCFLILISIVFYSSLGYSSPVDGLLERIDKGASSRFKTQVVEKSNIDYFEISDNQGKILIKGNNFVSISAGLNWYLKYYAGINLTWNCLQAKLPSKLPRVKDRVYHETKDIYRYYLNYCTFSYSMAFWNWERWEKEIDWMALHGINLCLSVVGTDVVWNNVLRRLGYSEKEIGDFIAGPAYQAWWLMNNLEGWGGPVSKNWLDFTESLQKKILKRMKEFGIHPIFPGYAGMVPHDAREKLGLQVQDPGLWCSYHRPAFLQPTDTKFSEVAKIYYEEQTKLFGKADFYSMDPFHEGGNTKGVDLNAAGLALWKSMKEINPKSVWVMQAWGGNPRIEMIKSIPSKDILILDLNSENVPQWGDTESSQYRKNGFEGHDWLYCMLLNFGGNVGLFGRLDATIDGYYKSKSSVFHSAMRGVGLTMEGIENNPMMYELVSELPWRETAFKKEEWIAKYCKARYGCLDKNILEAWVILASTIYNCPKSSPQQGTTESVFCAQPGDSVWQVSTWSAMRPYYAPEDIIKAARLFAKGSAKLAQMNQDNYLYDLVDIVRQAIAEKGRLTYIQMQASLKEKDANGFKKHSDDFLNLILLQDRLLGTRKEFMVGNWIENAKNLATTKEEKESYELSARTQITIWGNKEAAENGGLRDYAHKEWNGLLRDFYYERWKMWIDHKMSLFSDSKSEPLDFFKFEDGWTKKRNSYPTQPSPKTLQVALHALKTI